MAIGERARRSILAFALLAITACHHDSALSPHEPIIAVPNEPSNVGMCGGGSEQDPSPGSPGIFLCAEMTIDYCTNGQSSDTDADGLADYCEDQLSYAFRPQLRYTEFYDDIRGEPYWVARHDSAGHVIVGYLFAMYRDLGSVQYGCTPPAKLRDEWGCHNGDSESAWLTLRYDPVTQHWVLYQAVYSAHKSWNVSAIEPAGYAGVAYPAATGGYPLVWVSENKHANYFSEAGCNYANFTLGLSWDWCANNVDNVRLEWNAAWNIGSETHPYLNAVSSRDASYEYYGQGGVECFWTPIDFRGWVPSSIGGGQAGSYLSKLIRWGFAATGVPSCGYTPPPPPPPPPTPFGAEILVNAPWYYSSVSGGRAPFSFLWEVCALDCEGGPLMAQGEQEPDVVVHGWQFHSTEPDIYWTKSQWNLRLTVTDADGAEVSALYFVP